MSLPLIIQFALCPIVLISLLFVTAPYGRHYQSGWGPDWPNRVAWAVMELPALVVITLLVVLSPAIHSPQAWLPLLLWVMHYGYRTFVFPALMRPSDRTFPAMLVLFAILFNILNGFNNAQALIENGTRNEPLLSAHFVIGFVLFLAGFAAHLHSDHVIRNLRKPGETGYRVPQGGLFRWTSNPNYLGEVVQWTGWAVMTWSMAGLAFALFTFCNLAPRALSNHRWYREKFEDYPPQRRVLIPGIF